MPDPLLVRLADLIFGTGRRIHSWHQAPILTRWYVAPRGQTDRSDRTPRIFLHRLTASDDVRDLHDHPWSFVSVTIGGAGYLEHRRASDTSAHGCRRTIRRRPWSVAYRHAETLHAVELIAGRPQWTLILAGPRKRAWGFFTREGWVAWDLYPETDSYREATGHA